ncbi:recombinase family protein [Paenibacillus sp. GCM10012307]|uniref:Recombinase family protein n=1 Tax=Paenibacillus roseus TaxID=2798579 RepID=A0A934MVI1_9BACL|nr:recombinase family protein [Paenibacillus roseus]MBJ6362142.1 recombinase family protein [Paenibacillus roseus]
MAYTLPPGDYCAYLRKSRKDIEAEKSGDEDTYARHERILIDLAKRYGITIKKIYREQPISGEKIKARPEMQELLSDVEDNEWKGVLVVEVERLARGDTMDQGIVAQTFKFSDTLIVTPMRVYDPNNSDDEEYFEFGLFMSRREFKVTTRRLQNGRKGAAEEGRYPGNIAPYGYDRYKLPSKGFSLKPNPQEAPIVQLIFALYTHPDPEQRMGTSRISRHLNEVLQIPTRTNSMWIVATVNGILRNPTYAGFVRWNSRPSVKRRDGISRPRRARKDWNEYKGLHDPLISIETYELALQLLAQNGHTPAPTGKISNPFAGLIRCGYCGGAIVKKPDKKTHDFVLCIKPGCRNVSSYYHLVEDRVLQGLAQWLEAYKASWDNDMFTGSNDQLKLQALQESLKNAEKKRNEIAGQQNELHDLLEKKIYTVEMFLSRSATLADRLSDIEEAIKRTNAEIELEGKRQEARVEIIPQVEHVLSIYKELDDPAQKQALMRSVLSRIVYRKASGGRWSGKEDKFELELTPLIP